MVLLEQQVVLFLSGKLTNPFEKLNEAVEVEEEKLIDTESTIADVKKDIEQRTKNFLKKLLENHKNYLVKLQMCTAVFNYWINKRSIRHWH